MPWTATRLPAGRHRAPRRARSRTSPPPSAAHGRRADGRAALRRSWRSRRWPTRHGRRPASTCCGPTATCPTATAPTASAAARGPARPLRARLARPGRRAPGRARRSTSSAYNPNDVGGDIAGGSLGGRQLVLRPWAPLHPYRTPLPGVWLCSASTPPGAGAHGMCGWHAAGRRRSTPPADRRARPRPTARVERGRRRQRASLRPAALVTNA